ncbi:helix-turn-helix domain-containing protein [Sporosarcina aquimarina]|uniref:helix-turn-helix domain-containing protein n=1 Tax=Sporosarcina aquimarina TaxID=114975 RepID=UPI001C8ED3D2|nr:helix-turn-helix transcriptional regulator [Sporosarcina aquimarina]MBY0221963.1 helix-turn-helix transcriptional regulator [Sporosarcina aquimarina]
MQKIEYFLMRRNKRITLKQLAQACSCSIGLLSLYENDKTNMDANKVQKYKEFISNY